MFSSFTATDVDSASFSGFFTVTVTFTKPGWPPAPGVVATVMVEFFTTLVMCCSTSERFFPRAMARAAFADASVAATWFATAMTPTMSIPTTTSTMEIANAASIVTLPLSHHDAVALSGGASESASLFSTMHGPEETGLVS